MKDLGERRGINVDYNQKHVKDHTKEYDFGKEMSPKKMEEKQRKADSKLQEPKKPYRKKRRFKKIDKVINVEKIPGSN